MVEIPRELYFQVAKQLEQAIESGNLLPGTRLENEILLGLYQLGLSRPTMRRAMQYLVDRGMLVRKRGIGNRASRYSFELNLLASHSLTHLSGLAGKASAALSADSVHGAEGGYRRRQRPPGSTSPTSHCGTPEPLRASTW